MAPPAFLASSFGYTSVPLQTDWTDGIAAFRAMVLAQSPAWTESPANTFISPVDGSGRFFEIRLTRASATELTVRVRNQFGTILSDRGIQCGSPVEVSYYAGQFHASIDVNAGGGWAGGGILDQSARPQTSNPVYTYGFGRLSNTFVNDGQGLEVDRLFMLDNGSPASANRCPNQVFGSLGVMPLYHASGFTEHLPVKVGASIGGVNRRVGRMYQHYIVDETFPQGLEIPIPIDVGVTGVFRVLGAPVYSSSRFKIACRKA